jgi:hypothetical protein
MNISFRYKNVATKKYMLNEEQIHSSWGILIFMLAIHCVLYYFQLLLAVVCSLCIILNFLDLLCCCEFILYKLLDLLLDLLPYWAKNEGQKATIIEERQK